MIPLEKNILEKKLFYQSKNRGCKEMEIILTIFANKYLNQMNTEELQEFAQILNQADVDLYDWINQKSIPPKNLLTPIMQKLIND